MHLPILDCSSSSLVFEYRRHRNAWKHCLLSTLLDLIHFLSVTNCSQVSYHNKHLKVAKRNSSGKCLSDVYCANIKGVQREAQIGQLTGSV